MSFRKSLLIGLAVVAAVSMSGYAYAEDSKSEVEILRAEVVALKAQMAAISEKLDSAAKAQEEKSKIEVKWKGAPEIKGDGGWSFKPRGRIQYDVGTVNAPNAIVDPGLGFANEARRIRLGASGKIPGGFGFKMEADLTNGEVVLTDAFFTYKDKGLTITAGQQNPFQGLEELSSSNDTSFIERSAWTDAFDFKRRVGLSAQYASGPVLVQGGVFTDNITDLGDDGNNSIGLEGRVAVAPKIGDTQLHFGGSYHWYDFGDTITTARYRQRPLVHVTDTRFINTGNISAAKSQASYGLEAAAIAGRFHAAAETHWLKLNRTGFADPTFFGGSIEAGIFLTDDTRRYKNGYFDAVKVKNPVGKGGFGALQFNVRYDHLDLNDAGIIGGIQESYQASLIWTPVDYVRFMLNYGNLSYKDAAIAAGATRDYSVDVVGARAQFSF